MAVDIFVLSQREQNAHGRLTAYHSYAVRGKWYPYLNFMPAHSGGMAVNMSTYGLILKRRTIRKFQQKRLETVLLEKFVNAARMAPSGSNLQPLKYVIVNDAGKVRRVFEQVKWAGYIAPLGNPAKNERPVAFIIILADTEIRKTGYELDVGAAAQSIFLAAAEEGIGTCWMGAIDRDGIRKILGIPERYIIDTAVALGYPAESPVSEAEKGSIRYYKDENGTLHVPKRSLEEVMLKL